MAARQALALEPEGTGFKFWLPHFLAVWSWVVYLFVFQFSDAYKGDNNSTYLLGLWISYELIHRKGLEQCLNISAQKMPTIVFTSAYHWAIGKKHPTQSCLQKNICHPSWTDSTWQLELHCKSIKCIHSWGGRFTWALHIFFFWSLDVVNAEIWG